LALVKNVSFRFVAPAKIESKGAKKKGERGRRRGASLLLTLEYFNLWQFDTFSMLRAVNFCALLSSFRALF